MTTMAMVTPVPYGLSVATGALACVGLCLSARRRPGLWTVEAARAIGAILVIDAVSFMVGQVLQDTWSFKSSLPLALCNVSVLVAAAACWWRGPLLAELTWFWGMAGALQAVITPDLNVGFPHLVFFQYVVGHIGIVLAALFLVTGLRLTPRQGAVARTLGITAAYTAFVGLVDGLTGANYMFLRDPPPNWTVLRLLGPWPWYVFSAAGLAIVLVVLLDLPFRRTRRQDPVRAA